MVGCTLEFFSLQLSLTRFTSDREQAVAGGRGLPSTFISQLRITCGCLIKIVSLQKFSSLLVGFQASVVIKVLELGFLIHICQLYAVARGKIMSRNEDDVKNDSDNDLGDDFDYQPNAEDDVEDDNVDSLDSTSKSEKICGVK
ncbi:hypothetical protein Ahy_A09g042292 isoform D [Arachis hypogaea]|uniref:Uncharacterized protein n=1 Tax=Arachis hypogaea TaxID=3818 RepID=A0A445BFF1_ARAHY|nr:hypothetical protein Ahy_A09g042292 isoform D [Arachis hypogaea]